MSRKIAGFLIALGAFMVVEWINLGFNLADGHATGFYVVHGILIVVNVVLGIALGLIGWRGLRARGRDGSAGLGQQ
ncbi:SCO4848 family membrane protein [Nonomuraea sp. CA-218870]|uniref:SCO4848 family membrane protein n=1 Tax=Nonomuraea sp. CA-218870 TaxID=3239998 RepID=UPI003D924B07